MAAWKGHAPDFFPAAWQFWSNDLFLSSGLGVLNFIMINLKVVVFGFLVSFLGCRGLLAQTFLNVGADSQSGQLDGVRYESCGVSYFLDENRVYLCYRQREEGDLVVGEQVWGVDAPVTKTYPDGALVARMVLAIEDDGKKARYLEFPKEAFRTVTYPHTGNKRAGDTTALAIVLTSEKVLTVFLTGGDGAGSYRLNWEVNVKENKVRMILQESEINIVGKVGPWLELKEIEQPKIKVDRRAKR